MLPADVARCPGNTVWLVLPTESMSGTLSPTSQCTHCLRRTEPAHERQVWMAPMDEFPCRNRIGPQGSKEGG